MQPSEESEKTPASVMQVKRIIRLKLRRQDEPEENFLNIYPMMDMMTIILVFLIMQFASSSASVVQESPELKIPFSESVDNLSESIPIQISRNEITVDGERVLTLREGQVDPSYKQGGSNGFKILPLLKRMQSEAEIKKAIAASQSTREFLGEVLIIADGRTPFRTLSEVLYTLGQAEFSRLKFVVNRKSFDKS